jgi:hypothetical protein
MGWSGFQIGLSGNGTRFVWYSRGAQEKDVAESALVHEMEAGMRRIDDMGELSGPLGGAPVAPGRFPIGQQAASLPHNGFRPQYTTESFR